MGNRIDVHRAKLCDLNAISSLIGTCFKGPESRFTTAGQNGYVDYLRLVVTHPEQFPKQHLYVGQTSDETVLFADLRVQDDRVHLSRICVDGGAQGVGIGTEFLGQLWQLTEPRPWTLDVFVHNIRARKLYQRLGFTTANTSTWRIRQAPAPSGVQRIEDFAHARAAYLRYGFTPIAGENHSFRASLVGQSLRLHKLDEFSDDSFIAGVRKSFPEIETVLYIDAGPVPTRQHYNETHLHSDHMIKKRFT